MFATTVSSLLKYKVTRFDGSNDFVTMGNVLGFERTAARTVGFWAKWTSSGTTQSVFNKLQNTSPFPGWDIFFSSAGNVGFAMYNQGDTAGAPNRIRIVTTAAYNDGRWHHIVGTYDGSSNATGMAIYIDGSVAGTAISANNLTASMLTTAPMCFGARGQAPLLFPFAGVAHDFFIYDKQLSAGEVATIHASHCPPDLTAVGPTANLIGYWLAGEHKGDTNLAAEATSFPTVPDASSGANAGTMTNMSAAAVETRK